MTVTIGARAAAALNRASPFLSLPNVKFGQGRVHEGTSIISKHQPNSEETRYIIQDFDSHLVFVDIEVFMKHVLHVPDNWRQQWAGIIQEIRADAAFAGARFEYNAQCEKSSSKEEDFYGPLVSMVNAAFKCLSSSKKFKLKTRPRCPTSDPRKILGGMMSELVPDIATAHEDFSENVLEKGKKEKRLAGPNLTWANPIQMMEVKPGGNLLVDGSQMPRLVVNGKDPKVNHAKPHEKGKAPAKSGRAEQGASAPFCTKRPAEGSPQASRKSQKKWRHSTAGGERPVVDVPTVETDGQKEAYLRVGRYLLEQFLVPAFRSHATIGMVDRDRIQFYHANHSVILVSSAVSFSTRHGSADVGKFIAILIAFSQLSLCDSGVLHNIQGTNHFADNEKLPTSKFPRDMKQMQQGHKLVLRDGKERMELTYGDVISHEPSLSGRGTAVLHATSPDREGDLVVKISWPGSGRVPEDKFLKEAVRIARSKKKHNWALNHLPHLEFSQSINFDSDSAHGKVANLFKNAKSTNGEYEYEERTLRIIVQERLFPLKTLTDPKEIAQVLLDVACVHRWLYDEVGILHRDLSLRNIMYRRNRKGQVCGVLTDFDLSSWTVDLAKDHMRTSQQRTGTPPYMAHGLLDGREPSHLYRHDAESFFYVMLLLTTRYEIRPPKGRQGGGVQILQEPGKLPFDDWFNQPYEHLAAIKSSFLGTTEDLKLSPTFGDFHDWLEELRFSFLDGVLAKHIHMASVARRKYQKGRSRKKVIPQFDDETLGGFINYSALVDPVRKLKGKLKGLVVRYRPK